MWLKQKYEWGSKLCPKTLLQYLFLRSTGTAIVPTGKVWSKPHMFGCSQLALQRETEKLNLQNHFLQIWI